MSKDPSRISGPIPPDPAVLPACFRHPCSARGRLEGNSQKLEFASGPLTPAGSSPPAPGSARPVPTAPGVRPSGRHCLQRGQKGTLSLLLQLQGISLEGHLPARRQEAKDHKQENRRRLKEIQRQCKEKQRAQGQGQPTPVRALWRSQRYEKVESKVKAKLQECCPPPNPEALNFLRAYSGCGPGIKPCKSLSPRPSRAKAAGRSIDFIRHNALNAKRAPLRRSQSLQALAELLEQRQQEQEDYNRQQKGHVPQYLLQRKELWRRQREEQLRSLPDPDTPAGHSRMPEGQRLETLSNLKQSQEQLIRDLVMLPVRADTLSMQKRKVELERKLSQLEEAIKIFSRPKVFIKLDS
ncbi:enkurin domain-containing protein 1 isoform X2 [Indicator indicator]|uniref:enkurin domain-containing protein 1 isoform X2 n=1 Tax=Indicator indicator TaxID=1002788 RepID=UPI0023DFBFCD|nr:enkurin domain-containing protein 1 isoform X2 [Indicator indicator]